MHVSGGFARTNQLVSNIVCGHPKIFEMDLHRDNLHKDPTIDG